MLLNEKIKNKKSNLNLNEIKKSKIKEKIKIIVHHTLIPIFRLYLCPLLPYLFLCFLQ